MIVLVNETVVDKHIQAFEVNALQRILKWLPKDSLVTVPAVHLFDDVANVIIMDDCGEGVKTLKQLMIDDPSSTDIARQIGAGLGDFLARFHSLGSADQDALDYFDKNHQAKEISAWATYGRLIPTLKGENAPLSMKDPVLDIPSHDLDAIAQIATQTSSEVMTLKETLVMGDFWPGNILVVWTSDHSAVQKIYVLDWELVKPGIAALDLGQFLAEMHLLRRFRPHSAEASSAVASAFLETYKNVRGAGLDDLAKRAWVHVGAHLVAWTPRNDWGPKEMTRDVVMEGVGYLLSKGGVAQAEIAAGLSG